MGGIPADFSIASHCCLDVPSGGFPLHTISNVDVNSSNGIRSGKPVRATRNASSTPLVWSWRASVVCSQQSGAFLSFGLKQRTKWRTEASRIE